MSIGVSSSFGFTIIRMSNKECPISKAGAELVRSIAPQAILQEKVDRPALSAIVLNNQALLNALEKLVHAEIRKQRTAFLSQARATKVKAAILDIPLLFETAAGGQDQFPALAGRSCPLRWC